MKKFKICVGAVYDRFVRLEAAAEEAAAEATALKPFAKTCKAAYKAAVNKVKRLEAAAEAAYYDFVDAYSAKFEEAANLQASAAAEEELYKIFVDYYMASKAEIEANVEVDVESSKLWVRWANRTLRNQKAAEEKAAAAKKAEARYSEWLNSDLAKNAEKATAKRITIEAVAKSMSMIQHEKIAQDLRKLKNSLNDVFRSTLCNAKDFIQQRSIPDSPANYIEHAFNGFHIYVTHEKGDRCYVSIHNKGFRCGYKLSIRKLRIAARRALKLLKNRKNLEKFQQALIENTQVENFIEDFTNCEFYKSKDYNLGLIEKFPTTFEPDIPSLEELRKFEAECEAYDFESGYLFTGNGFNFGRYIHCKKDGNLFKSHLENLGEKYLGARETTCEGRKLPTKLPSRVLFAGLGSKKPQCWVFFGDDPEGVWYFHANGYLYARTDDHRYKKIKTREYRGHELGRLLNNALLKKQAAEENVDTCIDDALNNKSGESKHQVNISTHQQMQHQWQNTMRKPQGEGIVVKKLIAQTKEIDGAPVELTEETVTDLAWTPMVGGVESTIHAQWVKANHNPSLYKYVERYTRSMLVVNLSGISDVDRLADKDQERYWEIVCLVPTKEKEGDLFFVKKFDPEEKVYFFESWFDKDVTFSENDFEDLLESPDFLGYWSYTGEYAVTSPGQVKQHCAILAGQWYGSKEDQEDDWYVDWESLYDELFGEAWQLWISDLNSRGYKEVSQFSTRMAHWTAPATGFPQTPAGSFALLNGKFTSKYIKDRDGNLVEYADGQDFINVAFMLRAFNAADKRFRITYSAILFQLFQHRSWAYCNKSDGWVIDDEGMELLFKRHGKGKVERVKVWALSEDDKAFWDYFMQTKGKVGSTSREDWIQKLNDLKGAIIIFYTNKKDYSDEALTADLFTDWNSLKCGFRPWKTTPYLKILAMSHDGGTKQVLSSQLIQTLVAGDPDKAWKLILGLMAVEIDKQLEKFYGQEKPEASYGDFAQLTKVEYDYNGKPSFLRTSFSRAIEELCYEFALKWDPNLYRKRAQNMFKKLNKEINDLNIPCYGVHTTLLPDIAATFCGHSVLNVDDKGIWKYYGVGDAGNVNMEKYIKNIENLKEEEGVSEEEKAYAIKAIKGIAPGISVAPVTDEFTRGNEGSDWDSDSIFIFYLMRALRSHVAKVNGEEVDDRKINEWIDSKIDKLISFFKKDSRCGLTVDYLKLAKAAKLEGDIDVALRYPNNHCEGICKLSESFIPEMLSVRIVEGTSATDAKYLADESFRGQLLGELNEVIEGIRKEVSGMFPHLNKSRFCGMVQFTRYIVTGIIPPGVYISAMNIHADARFAADRLRRMCKIVDEAGEMNCRQIIETLTKKAKRTSQENVMLDSAKFLMDYAAIIFGIEVDDYMSTVDAEESIRTKYKYARYTFETKKREAFSEEEEKEMRRTDYYFTPFTYDKNKINGVMSVTVSLGTSNQVVERARKIDDKIFIDDIFAIARDCEAVKRNGGEILIDSPKGIKDPSILGGLPLDQCAFTRQYSQTFEVMQRWVGDNFKDNKYPKVVSGNEEEYDGCFIDSYGGDSYDGEGYGAYEDLQDCCTSTIKQVKKVENQGGLTGEYIVLINDKDGQPAGNGNKRLKTPPGWCYDNTLVKGQFDKMIPIGRRKAIEHYSLYDVAQQVSYRSRNQKTGKYFGTAIDPLFRIMTACLGYLPEIAKSVAKKASDFKLPKKELLAMRKWSVENLKKVSNPSVRALVLDAQKALFNIKGVWADVNGGLKKEKDAIRKLYNRRIKDGFASVHDLDQAIKLHNSLNTMAYRGCENMARLLMERLAETKELASLFQDPIEQMRFVVQTLMDMGTSDIISDFGRLVMPEEFAIWQYFVTRTYGESKVPKVTRDRLHFVNGFKDDTVMTDARLAMLHGKKVNLQNGALVSSDDICWAYSTDPEIDGEFTLSVEEGKLYACTDIVKLMQSMRPAADQNQRCVQLWGKANMVGATKRDGISTRTCMIEREKVMELLREHDYVYIDAEDLERLLIKDENGRFITVGKIKCAYTFTSNMKDGNSAFYKKLLTCQERKNWKNEDAQLLKGKVKVALPCEKGKGGTEYKTVGLVLEEISFETYDWKKNGYYDNSFDLVRKVFKRPEKPTENVEKPTETAVVEEVKVETKKVKKEPNNIGGEDDFYNNGFDED